MKNFIQLLCLGAILCLPTLGFSVNSAVDEVQLSQAWRSSADEQALSIAEATAFSELTLKDLQLNTGRKLKLTEKAAFLYAKKTVKRQLRKQKKGHLIRRPGNNEGIGLGIVLGFFLGLIGVLIAYLALADKKPGVVKGSWIGWGISLVLGIILIAVVFSQLDTV